MRLRRRSSCKSLLGQGPFHRAWGLRGAPRGSARGTLIAVVLACLLIASGLWMWRRGRSASGAPSVLTRADLAASVAKMTPDQKQQAYQDEVNALQDRGTRLQSYLDSLPKTLTDLDALAQSFTTPQAAFEYVRDQIALEPYPGVLKGALGTLLTRGGNDLDRSLLLGALLKQQGIDFKIAHGPITAEQAQSLLQQMAGAPDAVDQILKSLPKVTKGAPAKGDDSEIRKVFQQGVDRRRKELHDTVELTFQQLQSSLKAAGIALGQDATAQRLAVLEDHYWVQATIDDKTVDLDPSPATSQLGQSLSTATETLDGDSLPDTLFQRLKFRVVAEHLKSGQVSATEVLSQEVNSVDLLGKNIRLAVEPESASPDVNHFKPVLMIGDNSTDGQPFSLRPDAEGSSSNAGEGGSDIVSGQSSDAGATGGQLGGLGGLGGGGLAGGGGEEAPAKPKPQSVPARDLAGHGEPVLARLYLEVVSTGPRLPEVHYRRVMMDRVETSGDKLKLLTALANDRSIRPLLVILWDGAITVGPFQPAYVFQTEAAAIAALEPLQEKTRAKIYLGEDFGDDSIGGPTLSPNLLNYFLASDLARHGLRIMFTPHARSYYERPRLAFFRHCLAVRDWAKPGNPVAYFEGLDLINSPFGVLGPTDEASTLGLKAGVADAALELHFTSRPATLNTLPLFAAAADQKVPLRTLLAMGQGALDTISTPAPIRTVLEEDLASGHALIAPTRLVTLGQHQNFGWWSIDPGTGLALGRMDLGCGQAMTETIEVGKKVIEFDMPYVNFHGAVVRCYYGAVADALAGAPAGAQEGGSAEPGGKKAGEGPTEQLVSCLTDAACDAIAEITAERAGAAAGAVMAAADPEAVEVVENFRQLILEWTSQELIHKTVVENPVGKACKAAAEGGLGN